VLCGGIAEKNPLVVQIYADVIGREMKLARSGQTCALGAAIFGAVAGGAFHCCEDAVKAMAGLKEKSYQPNPASQAVYAELFDLYMALHDAFGKKDGKPESLYSIMKSLIAIRDRQRKGKASH
jgi:L-ribulokinase